MLRSPLVHYGPLKTAKRHWYISVHFLHLLKTVKGYTYIQKIKKFVNINIPLAAKLDNKSQKSKYSL